jgi:hypothetical protein
MLGCRIWNAVPRSRAIPAIAEADDWIGLGTGATAPLSCVDSSGPPFPPLSDERQTGTPEAADVLQTATWTAELAAGMHDGLKDGVRSVLARRFVSDPVGILGRSEETLVACLKKLPSQGCWSTAASDLVGAGVGFFRCHLLVRVELGFIIAYAGLSRSGVLLAGCDHHEVVGFHAFALAPPKFGWDRNGNSVNNSWVLRQADDRVASWPEPAHSFSMWRPRLGGLRCSEVQAQQRIASAVSISDHVLKSSFLQHADLTATFVSQP